MTVKLSNLAREFRAKVETLLATCANKIRMVPTFTLRTPAEQAVFWRQSRSIVEIKKATDILHSEGANYLADVLDGVGTRNGPNVTNALSGNSWQARNPKAGGTDERSIIFAIFPGSGAGRGISGSEITARIQPIFDNWGGLARLKSYQGV